MPALFVGASERMDGAAGLDELWTVVAAEAAQVLGADAKVMQWTGQGWVILTPRASPSDQGDDPGHDLTAAVRDGTVVGADEGSLEDAMLFPRRSRHGIVSARLRAS